MAEHKVFTIENSVDVYFYEPWSPWQRGSNENTNGLLCQYSPKRADLNNYSEKQLRAIATKLNHRSRKTHDWRTPSEVFAACVAMTTYGGPQSLDSLLRKVRHSLTLNRSTQNEKIDTEAPLGQNQDRRRTRGASGTKNNVGDSFELWGTSGAAQPVEEDTARKPSCSSRHQGYILCHERLTGGGAIRRDWATQARAGLD